MLNEFSPVDNLPKKEDVEKLGADLNYIRLKVVDLPIEIKNHPLTQKFNSVILALSGSNSGLCATFVGLRPDKEKGVDVIDEHPFIFYFDNNNSKKNFGGILHHGDWEGRTIPLEQWQINAMSASGLTTEFTYKQIPPSSSGTLAGLSANNMLSGITGQFRILLQNDPNKEST